MSWILLGIPIGIVFLYFGSEWMVDGAKKMAIRLGVTPFLVGLTVVAMGSSAPELITSLLSSNNPQFIVGNIVGSNIANVGLAIGLAALITPVVCKFDDTRFEMFSMMAAVVIITILAFTGKLGLIQGIILIAALLIFLFFTYKVRRRSHIEETEEEATEKEESIKTQMWKCVLLVIVGIVLLYIGARAFIEGAVDLAGMFGVSELMIGLIVVAIGVCLPELCICIVAAYRKENELVVSNIVGSVVFNSFFALGIGVLFTTVPVTHFTMVFHMPIMILMALLLVLMIRFGNKVTRWEGAALICVYAVYIALMITFPELTQGLI
ncbi:calcium/sodium antiporter [Candidatus Methanoplasma termitum]|nr:calcium/sodium antiporter [Candidatus Methanoplasma termitum]MCL2333649.1 calcium/sodium antiporter [Candidatus Methanoplasma sp.]